jgi:hypothetical protein
MILTTYKVNRERKKISIKELDFNKFEKFAPTGWGWALKYKNGRTIYFYAEYIFDEMVKRQEQNDEAVKKKAYSYARIDENQSSSKQNTLRDNKGNPIRIYQEKEDCFLQIKDLKYLKDSHLVYDEAKKANKLFEWYDGKWCE